MQNSTTQPPSAADAKSVAKPAAPAGKTLTTINKSYDRELQQLRDQFKKAKLEGRQISVHTRIVAMIVAILIMVQAGVAYLALHQSKGN